MTNSDSFYDEIMNDAGTLMSKQASYDEESIEKALNDSDLSEEEINKLASEIEDMIDEDEDDIEIDEDGEGADEGDADVDVDVDEDVDADSDVDSDDIDVEQLAAYYDEVQEKYASAGKGVAQYVYDQIGNPDTEEAIHLATTIEETAEKLAYVSGISAYAVADDLLMNIASKLENGEDDGENIVED